MKRFYEMKEGQPLHYEQPYRIDVHTHRPYYHGNLKLQRGESIWVTLDSGAEIDFDLSEITIYVDMLFDGVLEVRFIGSRWTLVVEQRGGKIIGSITGQSAHTTTYKLESYGLSGQSPFRKNHLPPESAEDVLAGMMRKWQRRVLK